MDQTVIYALEIMGKGMLSIFTVILLLTLVVIFLTKVTNMKFFNKNEDHTED